MFSLHFKPKSVFIICKQARPVSHCTGGLASRVQSAWINLNPASKITRFAVTRISGRYSGGTPRKWYVNKKLLVSNHAPYLQAYKKEMFYVHVHF
jgi:hypothetical protein